jgi:hypothetical protein
MQDEACHYRHNAGRDGMVSAVMSQRVSRPSLRFEARSTAVTPRTPRRGGNLACGPMALSHGMLGFKLCAIVNSSRAAISGQYFVKHRELGDQRMSSDTHLEGKIPDFILAGAVRRVAQAVQSDTSDFGFEMQDSSNFKLPCLWHGPLKSFKPSLSRQSELENVQALSDGTALRLRRTSGHRRQVHVVKVIGGRKHDCRIVTHPSRS